ncbi:MAG: histidine utilization repressor [Pseudomonadota bacterium]
MARRTPTVTARARPGARGHVKSAGSKAAATASPVALFQQVKDHIARKIQDGTLRAGERLPSEHALVAQFGISRMTVNRALRELAEQGRIVRMAGVGSFVAEPKPQFTLLHIVNLASEIRARGHDYRCEMLVLERVAATLEVASALEVRTGESVYHSVCVHLENGVPIQLEDRYVNPRIAPEFIRQDFTHQQPSEFLVRTVPFDEIEHVVDAVLPTPEQATRLQMDPGQPGLLLTRRTWNGSTPVTLVRCLHPASRYRLGSRYRASGNPVST